MDVLGGKIRRLLAHQLLHFTQSSSLESVGVLGHSAIGCWRVVDIFRSQDILEALIRREIRDIGLGEFQCTHLASLTLSNPFSTSKATNDFWRILPPKC